MDKAKIIEVGKLTGDLKTLVDIGLIDEQGFRISGQGILITQIKELAEMTDKKTNIKLYQIMKELEKTNKNLETLISLMMDKNHQ